MNGYVISQISRSRDNNMSKQYYLLKEHNRHTQPYHIAIKEHCHKLCHLWQRKAEGSTATAEPQYRCLMIVRRDESPTNPAYDFIMHISVVKCTRAHPCPIMKWDTCCTWCCIVPLHPRWRWSGTSSMPENLCLPRIFYQLLEHQFGWIFA